MFLHFRVLPTRFFSTSGFIWLYLQVSSLNELLKCFNNNGSSDAIVCSRHEGGFLLYSCGPSPPLVIHCILEKLLSPVFRSYSIKAVLKLIVCILPTRNLAGKILVSAMDTLLQQCCLQFYNLSNLGPVHEKTPMKICCHPLRVEAWMLQPLTGEYTQTVLVKSNIGDNIFSYKATQLHCVAIITLRAHPYILFQFFFSFTQSVKVNALMMLAIWGSLSTIEPLQNELPPHFGASPFVFRVLMKLFHFYL